MREQKDERKAKIKQLKGRITQMREELKREQRKLSQAGTPGTPASDTQLSPKERERDREREREKEDSSLLTRLMSSALAPPSTSDVQRNVERMARKLMQEQAELVLQTPALSIEFSRLQEKRFTLLTSSKFERDDWRELIKRQLQVAGLLTSHFLCPHWLPL